METTENRKYNSGGGENFEEYNGNHNRNVSSLEISNVNKTNGDFLPKLKQETDINMNELLNNSADNFNRNSNTNSSEVPKM